MEINSLVILGNEFCNYNCEHCLRGPSRNNRITRETLEKFLSQVSCIYEVTFTGGEVTLYLEPIRWFIDICREKNIYVGNFYIVTNGHKYVPELISLCDELYEFCEDNEISGLAISDDPYHRMFQPDNFEQIVVQYEYPEASFGEREWWNPREYFREKDKVWNSGISLINEGNARTNMIGERNVSYYVKGEAEEISDLDMVLLRHNGDLFSSCDLSYDSMDDMAFKQDRAYIGNINQDTLENILNNFIK